MVEEIKRCEYDPMKIPAPIFFVMLLATSIFLRSSAKAQAPGMFPRKRAEVIEFAAKSSDDDDTPMPKRSHSSTATKSTDDDATNTPSNAKSDTKKKKKKGIKGSDDSVGDATPSPSKRSSVSDEDSPPKKLKKPPKKADDSSSTEKPKADDARPAKDTTEGAKSDASKHAPNATVEPGAIAEFATQPEGIQRLITSALELTKQNLTYTYGSSEPSNGGMDCSGTIFYLLHSQGFHDVPRDSSGQYEWARKHGQFFAVVSSKSDSFEFKDLLPGDLMFWTGTYQVERDIPISHVMLYLGTEKRTGNRIMFGASDGRSYNGHQRWGVSVFDFKMPKADSGDQDKRRVDFVGYARIPALRGAADSHHDAVAESGNKSAGEKDEAVKKPIEKDPDDSTPPPKKKSSAKKPTVKKRTSNSD